MFAGNALVRSKIWLSLRQNVGQARPLFKGTQAAVLPLTEADGRVVGLVYKDDLFNLGHDPAVRDLSVGRIMWTDFYCLREDTPLVAVCSPPAAVFSVVDGQGRFSGILTREVVCNVLPDSAILMVEKLITLLDSMHNGIIAVKLIRKESLLLTRRPRKLPGGRKAPPSASTCRRSSTLRNSCRC